MPEDRAPVNSTKQLADVRSVGRGDVRHGANPTPPAASVKTYPSRKATTLYRYRSIKRWTDGRKVYDLARQIFPEVIPVTSEVLDHARHLLDANRGLAARDALHAAVVIGEGLEAICTYDRDFDGIPGVRRIEPAKGGQEDRRIG